MASNRDIAYQYSVEVEKSRLGLLSNEELLLLPEYQSQTITFRGVRIFVATHHDTAHEGFHAFVVQAERKFAFILAETYIAGFILDSNQVRQPLPQEVVYEYS